MVQLQTEYTQDVFREVNCHMRTTEQKHLAISGSFLGLLAALLSLLYEEPSKFLSPSDQTVMSHVVLLFLGCITYLMQHWYRIWKLHYLAVLNRINRQWEVDKNLVPCWLQDGAKPMRSVDAILPKVVLLVNLILLLLLSVYFITTGHIINIHFKVFLVLGLAALFFAFNFWVHSSMKLELIENRN